MTRVAILWHMHQPFYEDPSTGEYLLPWVRLHALKDYYGMAALLREFPGVRVTFNLVPSLLVQLESYAAGRVSDPYLDLSLKPATELTEADASFIRDNFFHAQRQRMIEAYPRYAELLARRGRAGPAAEPSRAAFTTDELRDLQVWHKLAWVDPVYLSADDRIRGLVAKGRQFTEADKALLRSVEVELLNLVIPEYRTLAARGQIELSTSPFYHPILPLLCDTDVYLRTHPGSSMPRRRFQHPEDAAEQLARAVACHERLFGHRPTGLWPSEGSVSDAMVPLVAAAGFTWTATDEQILARSLGVTFTRDASGHLDQPERLYAPYDVRAGGARVACAFRDHVLSDLIGFTYAGWPADQAAADLVARVVEAGRRYARSTGGGEAVVPLILDGENAWEHFEGGGRPFLRAFYSRLSANPELQTVTMSEACADARHELAGIFPGSWVDANFSIWIGHRDDQLAWSQLEDARQALGAASGVTADALAQAREEVLVAEGSDWFWWYGDDHSSEQDLEFDELFRSHLRKVYQLLGRPAPEELFISNISAPRGAPLQTEPTSFVQPRLDGEVTSYFEWAGAGALEVREGDGSTGTMHRTERQPPFATSVRFGFDRGRLFVRLDCTKPVRNLLADGIEVSLKFLAPPGVRFSVRQEAGGAVGTFWDREDHPPGWRKRGPGGAQVAVGQILELALPWADLGLAVGAPVEFFVAMYEEGSLQRERHPSYRPIELVVPDALFEARHWRA